MGNVFITLRLSLSLKDSEDPLEVTQIGKMHGGLPKYRASISSVFIRFLEDLFCFKE